MKPLVLLDFRGVVDRRLSFSRASAGSRLTAGRRLVTAPAGQPRLTYDATTGDALGLLVEGAATNRLLHSRDLTAGSWSKSGVTVAPSPVLGPDGVAASRITVTSPGANQIGQLVSGAAGLNTASLWLRADAPVTVTCHHSDYVAGQSFTVALTREWQRFSHSLTYAPGTTLSALFPCFNTSSPVSFDVANAQLESGPLSSDVMTATASATRAGESAQYPLSGLDWDGAGGTLVVEWVPPTPAPTGLNQNLATVDGGAGNRLALLRWEGNQGALAQAIVSDATTIQAASVPIATGQRHRAAAAWGGGLLTLAVDGVVAQSFSGALPTFAGGDLLLGSVTRAALYPQRAAGAALCLLTV